MGITEDLYLCEFIGTKYDFSHVETVGDLRSLLYQIALDLPEEDKLELTMELDKGELEYILEQPIFTGKMVTEKQYIPDKKVENETTHPDIYEHEVYK